MKLACYGILHRAFEWTNYLTQDSVLGAGIAQMVWGRTAVVQFPAGARYFSLLGSDQTGSGAHLASYPMDTGGSYSGVKATGP
jgi:hypothetical protein